MPMVSDSGTTMSDAWHNLNGAVRLTRILPQPVTDADQTITESPPKVVYALPESYGLRMRQFAKELTARVVVAPPYPHVASSASQEVVVSREARWDIGLQVAKLPRKPPGPWPWCASQGDWTLQASNDPRLPFEPSPVPVALRVWTVTYLTTHKRELAISGGKPQCPKLSQDPCQTEFGLIDRDGSRDLELLQPACKPQMGLPSEDPRALGRLGYPSSRVMPPFRPLAPRLRVALPSPETLQSIQ